MRDADIAISSYLLRRLRAAADLMELPNPESVAEMFLEERLRQMPEVEELIAEQKKASQKIREQWKARQGCNATHAGLKCSLMKDHKGQHTDGFQVWSGSDQFKHEQPRP